MTPAGSQRVRLAPAKVNLYLHVAGPDARGYHPLQSLVVFADIGDEVRILSVKSEVSGHFLRPHLMIDGPFGEGLSAGEDNLILKAVRGFEEASGSIIDRHNIGLSKNLPIASGIGGGSADAGAVLHLLRDSYCPTMGDDKLSAIARGTGADGVMCLWARASLAEGYGERLTPATVPRVSAVLINPLVACSTAAVYSGLDDSGAFSDIETQTGFCNALNIEQLIDSLRQTRNDLQASAIRLQPVIADVLVSLEAQPETLLARMSGSGATCFALCADDESALTLSRRLERLWPGAWIRSCRLG